jgi:hypothetical protein
MSFVEYQPFCPYCLVPTCPYLNEREEGHNFSGRSVFTCWEFWLEECEAEWELKVTYSSL